MITDGQRLIDGVDGSSGGAGCRGGPRYRSPQGRHRHHRNRQFRNAAIAACLVVLFLLAWTVVGSGSSPVAARRMGWVNFSHVVQPVSSWDVGLGASTYGATVLSSTEQARNEKQLDAAMVRIPVSVRNGVLVSGASGAGSLPVAALVQRYLLWGYRVLVVIDGSTDEFAVSSADARTIIAQLGYDNGVQYSSSNEPDQAHDLAATIDQARLILAEGRSLYPDFRIWGPVWSHYDRRALHTFAVALGSRLAGIDYHAYAMGQTSISTAAALSHTSSLQTQVKRTIADLRALGLTAGVAVDELNLTWRFDDGTPGGDRRLLTAVDTVWLASACGHVLAGGGSCLPYADQNGPLGMLTEAGQIPRDRPSSSPMPGYWGIAAWTGAGLFPHLAGGFLHTRSALPGVEIFAVGNTAAGYNVVVINKNSSPASTPLVVGLKGLPAGTYTAFSTDPARPFAAPVSGAPTSYRASVSLDLRPMSVTTVVLRPR